MDGVTPQDFGLFDADCLSWIADILNLIEAGARWPSDSLHIAAHMLAKDPEDSLNPMSYRSLMVTPSLYRVWDKLRLVQLQQWTSKWILKEMFAGGSGAAASDAWYLSSLDFEMYGLQGTNYCGGTCDLYKCFDQVIRPLLYSVLALAGLPTCVLTAYVNFQENALVHHLIQGTLGERANPPLWNSSGLHTVHVIRFPTHETLGNADVVFWRHSQSLS